MIQKLKLEPEYGAANNYWLSKYGESIDEQLIYIAKGFDADEAFEVAKEFMIRQSKKKGGK